MYRLATVASRYLGESVQHIELGWEYPPSAVHHPRIAEVEDGLCRTQAPTLVEVTEGYVSAPESPSGYESAASALSQDHRTASLRVRLQLMPSLVVIAKSGAPTAQQRCAERALPAFSRPCVRCGPSTVAVCSYCAVAR